MIVGPLIGSCYSVESTTMLPDQTIKYTWKSRAGDSVAIGSVDPSSPTVYQISCNGVGYTVDTNSAACKSSGETAVPSCETAGTCVF